MPVILGADLVQGGDDWRALQGKTILIDDIREGRQNQEGNQQGQDRNPRGFHVELIRC